MGQISLNLPVDIPWKQICVSPDMMDTTFCDSDNKFPYDWHNWHSSLAISVYEPSLDDLPAELSDERITYLKVTATITGYQPSQDEIASGHASFPNVPIDDLNRIFAEYWGCYGVLLAVAVFPDADGKEVTLARYPHIIDFEPKSRDLYQLATDTGELLTASRSQVNTNKSHTRTDKTDLGINIGSAYDSGPTPDGEFKGDWRIAPDWGTGDQDGISTQVDASRERRESFSSTTNITQMYNLLTGYHLGTNRAVFLMLPRPHTLQATSYRTFVQGLRMIEGVQEFFLMVSRPRDVAGLKVEAYLETGHFSEETEPISPPPDFDENYEDFIVNVTANTGLTSGETVHIQDSPNARYALEPGWVVDRRPTRQGPDPFSPGIHLVRDWSNGQANRTLRDYACQPVENDSAVQVSGTIQGGHLGEDKAEFVRCYRIFTRSEQPKTDKPDPLVTTPCLITCRELCCTFSPGAILPCKGVGLAPSIGSIVSEGTIVINPNRLPLSAASNVGAAAVKNALRQMQTVMMAKAGRLNGRVTFTETDYFKNKILQYFPPESLQQLLADVPGLPPSVMKSLGKKLTVAAALNLDLANLVHRAQLSVEKAVEVRRHLITFLQRRKTGVSALKQSKTVVTKQRVSTKQKRRKSGK